MTTTHPSLPETGRLRAGPFELGYRIEGDAGILQT
ncbi:hypothetical protein LPJGGPFB_01407 [Ensifer adhaerens]|nr:hypothetical protein [Ensifer adhaerens]